MFDQIKAKKSSSPTICACGWEYHLAILGERFASMFEPSSGGTGSIFNAKRTRFKNPPVSKNISIVDGSWAAESQTNPRIVNTTNAIARFMTGPAAETSIRPHFPWRNLYGFTGINPHAIPSTKNMTSDTAPMCTTGFAVMCPRTRGVSSPSQIAAQPWASSCRVIEAITQKIHETSSVPRPELHNSCTHQPVTSICFP